MLIPASSIATPVSRPAAFELEYIPEELGRVELSQAGEPSDYGVHLGEGLFYDTNGNLTLVPHRVRNQALLSAESFSVETVTDTETVDRGTVTTAAGATFVERRANLAVVDAPQRPAPTVIAETPGGLRVDNALIEHGQGYTTLTRADGSKTVIASQGNSLLVDQTRIEFQGDRITIEGPDGCTVLEQSGSDLTVRRQDGTVRFSHDGNALVMDAPGRIRDAVLRPLS